MVVLFVGVLLLLEAAAEAPARTPARGNNSIYYELRVGKNSKLDDAEAMMLVSQ